MFKGHGGNLAQIQEECGWHPSEIIDFSANTNPLGPPPALQKAFHEAYQAISSYPDPDSRNLLRKASLKFDFPASQIMAGNGSTEFIFLIPRALEARSVFVFHPTYQDYEESARLAGCRIDTAILNLSPQISDLHEGLSKRKANSSIVFICNPNNPTGRSFSGEELRWLIRQHPSLFFILDEAYVDFSEREETSLLRFPVPENLIILRSLTKVFTIPGLRLGLAFGPEKVIRKLKEHQDPWSVNTPAQKTGEICLDQKHFLDESRRWIQKERIDFIKELREVDGFEPLPSEVNYLLVRLTGEKGGEELKRELLEKKILIRSFYQVKGLGKEFIRLAVKKKNDRELLLASLSGRKR